jgi:hypothetical protein
MWINSQASLKKGPVRPKRAPPRCQSDRLARTVAASCPGMKEPFRSKRFQGVEVQLPMHGLNDRHNERVCGKVILPQGEWLSCEHAD